MRFNEAATETLDEQAGAISRQQLLGAGCSGAQIDAMLRHGHLERVEHGVYRRTASGRPPQQEEVIALLRCGPGARLTGARLLGHLGVGGFAPRDPFIVLVGPGRRVGRGIYDVRPDLAPTLHAAAYGPVAGTTPGRALVELAADLTRGDEKLLSIFDRMRWRGVVTRSQLVRVVEDLGGHPGAVRFRELLPTNAAMVESPPERELEAELASLEPPLEWQVWLGPDLRVDALWRDVALVIEYQGANTHDDPRDRDHDRQRHGRIRTLGYEVVCVDRFDLRQPDVLRARLLAARAARQQELARLASSS